MARNILITGGSGYLGGDILARLATKALPNLGRVFALVRSDTQQQAVEALGFTPMRFDAHDARAVEDNVVPNDISVVVYMISARDSVGQECFIPALAKVKAKTGLSVHIINTSGAKLVSNLTGLPTDKPLYDDEDIYSIQKAQVLESGGSQQPPSMSSTMFKEAVKSVLQVIDKAEAAGVRCYTFFPCIVYGESGTFGNPISIQTVAVIKAALACRRVYRVEEGRPTWPVSHISDTTNLYLAILRSILQETDIGHDRSGYYLAASGSVAWDDFYAAVAETLFKRGLVDTAAVETADDAALEKMAEALDGPKEFVRVQLSGESMLTARRGLQIGWKPEYAPEHILEAADAEVELVVKHLNKS